MAIFRIRLAEDRTVFSTPTRFRQTPDDSIALGARGGRRVTKIPPVLFPFCSQEFSPL